MKKKVAELEGGELDYWVALSVGEENPRKELRYCIVKNGHTISRFAPSSEWAHGGPLIDKFKVGVEPNSQYGWGASIEDNEAHYGPTPLIAICRAIVSDKLCRGMGTDYDFVDREVDSE